VSGFVLCHQKDNSLEKKLCDCKDVWPACVLLPVGLLIPARTLR
jgi:hypothetical protein